jgi:1,4-dihydroxy-2-naphthoyl-CoA hydrolase
VELLVLAHFMAIHLDMVLVIQDLAGPDLAALALVHRTTINKIRNSSCSCFLFLHRIKEDNERKKRNKLITKWRGEINMIKNTLIEALGIEITHLEEGKVIATMPVDERTKQPFGLLHGGASVALAETVASVGAYELVDKENEAVAGLEINANHVRPKTEGIVTAVGTVLYQGRTTMVWDIKITDEQDRLICVSRCTMAVIKLKNNA